MRLLASTKITAALAAGLAAGTIAVGLAAPASADYDTVGYVNALDAAGLIDHDGDHCNIINGVCHGQFDDGPSSLSSGYVGVPPGRAGPIT
jgi:hypothetical protein